MQVDVIATVNEARSDDFMHKTVIALDVLRATSTIVTALTNGASGVMPVETVNNARECKEGDDLLGGERNCKKITGFDFGNSPLEYEEQAVRDKRIVLTTTNGTRAIQKANKALHLLAGSMLNATACAQAALQRKRDVVLLCAGTKDEFALEDGLCAGLIADRLQALSPEPVLLNDLGVAMQLAYRQAEPDIASVFENCASGIRLAKLGLDADVRYCAQVDLCSTVPVLCGNVLIAQDSSKILSRS